MGREQRDVRFAANYKLDMKAAAALKLGVKGPFRNVPATIPLLARQQGGARVRHPARDMAEWPRRYQKSALSLSPEFGR
jgi:hypothetical protein